MIKIKQNDVWKDLSTEQVQSDWTETDSTKKSFIQHKPTLSTVATTGSYNDLLDKPTNLVTTDTEQNITGTKTYDMGTSSEGKLKVTDYFSDGLQWERTINDIRPNGFVVNMEESRGAGIPTVHTNTFSLPLVKTDFHALLLSTHDEIIKVAKYTTSNITSSSQGATGYATITAPYISGYTFVAWLNQAPHGVYGSCWLEDDTASTTSCFYWMRDAGTFTIVATALYRKTS